MKGIILAAGRGTRMKESIPKVLITVEGVPLVKRVHSALSVDEIDEIIVVTNSKNTGVMELLKDKVSFCYQDQPIGTLDAVLKALPMIEGDCLITPCDIPLLDKEIIREIISSSIVPSIVVMEMRNPKGFGRVITSNGNFLKIVEERDATIDELSINLVNSGIAILNRELIETYSPLVQPSKISNEYYLTDLLTEIAKDHNVKLIVYSENNKLKGVNDISSLKSLLGSK